MSQQSLINFSLYVNINHCKQNFAHLHALLKLEDRMETSTTTRSDIWPGVATSELCRFPERRRAMITLTQYVLRSQRADCSLQTDERSIYGPMRERGG